MSSLSSKILVINTGSSSLKFQLIEMYEERSIIRGTCERIGEEMGHIEYNKKGRIWNIDVPMADHRAAFAIIKKMLIEGETRGVKSLDEIAGIGHRAVQGGEKYVEATLVTQDVKDAITEMIPIAPIHNRATLSGFEAAEEAFGDLIPQVAVFDNAFHNTMKPEAYIYALPYEFYTDYKIRKYGYHGASHRYVTERLRELYPAYRRVISCHLGNGASLCAVLDGKCVDTTMGLTPLGGFMMGTRSGSLDPSVVTFIGEKEGLSMGEMSDLLNKKSGLLGVSGVSSDDRDVTAAENEGNARAKLAHEMLYYQIAQYVGSYYVAMGGCDAIVFTAGLGENQPVLREKVCDYLACLGVDLDKDVNNATIHGKQGMLTKPDSKIRVELIATDEEMVIARDTRDIVANL